MTKNELRKWRMKNAGLDLEHEAGRMLRLGIAVARSSSPRRSGGRREVFAHFPGAMGRTMHQGKFEIL